MPCLLITNGVTRSKKRRFGAEVTRFTKAEKIYDLTFALKGTETTEKREVGKNFIES